MDDRSSRSPLTYLGPVSSSDSMCTRYGWACQPRWLTSLNSGGREKRWKQPFPARYCRLCSVDQKCLSAAPTLQNETFGKYMYEVGTVCVNLRQIFLTMMNGTYRILIQSLKINPINPSESILLNLYNPVNSWFVLASLLNLKSDPSPILLCRLHHLLDRLKNCRELSVVPMF